MRLCAALLELMIASAVATDWASISPLMPTDLLPTIPSLQQARSSALHGVTFPFPFATFTIRAWDDAPTSVHESNHLRVDTASVACNTSSDWSPLQAGPRLACADPVDFQWADASAPTGTCHNLPVGSQPCLASMVTSGSASAIQLNAVPSPSTAFSRRFTPSTICSRLLPSAHAFHPLPSPSQVPSGASGYATAHASPVWAQLTFPALPDGVASVTLRYTMDSRYRPALHGGNPCPTASPTHNCSLCTAAGFGPQPQPSASRSWDHRMPAGIFVLWSAAGRSDYLITGPYSHLGTAWDDGELEQVLDSPPELNLQSGEFPVVAFLSYSQYPAPSNAYTRANEAEGHLWCWLSKDSPDPYPRSFTNTAFFLDQATILYRQALALPAVTPPGLEPPGPRTPGRYAPSNRPRALATLP